MQGVMVLKSAGQAYFAKSFNTKIKAAAIIREWNKLIGNSDRFTIHAYPTFKGDSDYYRSTHYYDFMLPILHPTESAKGRQIEAQWVIMMHEASPSFLIEALQFNFTYLYDKPMDFDDDSPMLISSCRYNVYQDPTDVKHRRQQNQYRSRHHSKFAKANRRK